MHGIERHSEVCHMLGTELHFELWHDVVYLRVSCGFYIQTEAPAGVDFASE